ncbi:MAG TPA: VOC family protein [Candidatus Baltobacteraceae bacterium]|jgi:catechol 2,3-dioxygenase-like lactoylglutathione lyase family enzyme
MKVALGRVGHFGLAVRDPKQSARWWESIFDVEEMFEGDDYVGITSRDVTIVLMKGKPNPETIDHVSFHLPDMDALRAALDVLKERGVEVEDPGDEVGPEAKGSPNMGLWFHDPDGYRWELSVQAKR